MGLGWETELVRELKSSIAPAARDRPDPSIGLPTPAGDNRNAPAPRTRVTWGRYHMSTPLELLIVLVMGLGMLGIGVAQFRRAE
jgi:hypothetical protein